MGISTSRARAAAFVLWCAGGCVVFAADASINLDSLLARPVSPGSITLLAVHARDERARARVIEAVASADPAVRAAAARVVNVSAIGAAVPAIRDALRIEQVPSAALEQARALLALDAASARPLVLDLAERLHREGASVAAQAALLALARAAGPASWQDLNRLTAITTSVDVWRTLALAATRRGRVGVAQTASALLESGNVNVWQGLLTALLDARVPLPDVSVLAALNAGPPRSAMTCWQLALVGAEARSKEVLAAIGASMSNAGAANQACETVLRLAEPGADTGRLLEAMRSNPPAELSPVLRNRVPPFRQSGERTPPTFSTTRMASEYPPQIVDDVAAVAGCRWPDSAPLIAGDLTFDVHGRPQRGSLATAGLRGACEAVAQALLLTNLAPREHTPVVDGRELVVLPFTTQGMQCLARQDSLRMQAAPVRVGERGIKPPTKTRDVRPVYPREAQRNREEGIVTIDAALSPSGCVEDAAVVRGLTPLLDIAALQAVAQWQFTPADMDGVPVPVRMTVTVQFALR